jgi:hypothetical protein
MILTLLIISFIALWAGLVALIIPDKKNKNKKLDK